MTRFLRLLTLTALSVAMVVTLTAQAPVRAIHDIQGVGAASAFAGQIVTTAGIVTARRSNGLFIQTAESDADADPRTSQGLFVFTGTTPAATLTAGTVISVTGRVLEFVPAADPRSPPLTELTDIQSIEVRGAGATLPAPVEISAALSSPTVAHDTLERFEGMRVRVATLTIVSPTLGTVTESSATASSNGVFYGVVADGPRPFREAGIDIRIGIPSGAPCCVPVFDGNPERLRVDSDGQLGAANLLIGTGWVLLGMVGVLDYAFQSYTLLPDPQPLPAIDASRRPVVGQLRPPADDEIVIASLNLRRFFDTTNDPLVADAVLTQAAFTARLRRLALYAGNTLHFPDVLAVQEVENLSTLQTAAATLNQEAMTRGLPNPRYDAYLEEGNDPGGIDVGVLVKRSRLDVPDVRQVGKWTTFVNPAGQSELLNDRPPLVISVRPAQPGPLQPLVTVIVNHFRSLIDIDDAVAGPRVRVKRALQAEYLADLVQQRLTDAPDEHLVVLGDFNGFEVNDGYADVVNTARGAPPRRDESVVWTRDRVTPDLMNALDLLPPSERYSYVFDGTAQALDHVLVSPRLWPLVRSFAFGRGHADAPELAEVIGGVAQARLSDHDAAVLYLQWRVR